MSKRGVYSERTLKILDMFDAGERDYWKIGETVGLSYGRVASVLSTHGRTRAKGKTPLRYGCRVNVAVPRKVVEEARARGWSTCRMLHELMDAIIEDNLFKALLEET